MPRYSCNFQGQCEPDAYGSFPSKEGCQSQCESRSAADLNYLIYQYEPESAAFDLAPSDQARVLKRLTGVDVSHTPEQARDMLLSLKTDADIETQLRYPLLRRYFEDQDQLTLDRLLANMGPKSLAELQSMYPSLHRGWIGPVETREQDLQYLMGIAIRDWLESALEYFYQQYSNILNATFLVAIEEGEFTANEHDGWVLNHVAGVPNALIPYIESSRIDFVAAAYQRQRYEEGGVDILSLVLNFGTPEFVQRYIQQTGDRPDFTELLRDAALGTLAEFLSWGIYTPSEIRAALFNNLHLVTPEVLEVVQPYVSRRDMISLVMATT